MTRRVMAALLAAAAMIPAAASAQGQRPDRDSRAQNDGNQAQRPQPTERQSAARAERRTERQAPRGDQQNGQPDRRQAAGRDRNGNGAPVARRDNGGYGQPRLARNRDDSRPGDARRLRDRNGDGRVDVRRDRNPAYRNDGNRDYAQRWNGNSSRWNNNWRQDRRYDWNNYRSYNRGAFHLPRYYAPHGWNNGYRRFSVGIRLAAPLFGENYWIDDPYDYRLPPAYGQYRWVRYYGDAILVDVRSGYVVDVIHDIFW